MLCTYKVHFTSFYFFLIILSIVLYFSSTDEAELKFRALVAEGLSKKKQEELRVISFLISLVRKYSLDISPSLTLFLASLLCHKEKYTEISLIYPSYFVFTKTKVHCLLFVSFNVRLVS